MTNNTEDEVEPPHEFICSLTMDLMNDPVVSRYGQSFERSAIIEWLARGNDTCPMTRQPLKLSDLITNHQLRAKIRRWQIENNADVTVIADSSFGSRNGAYFGFVLMPEEDPDPTERSQDDDAIIVEHPPHPPQRRHHRRSHHRHSSGRSPRIRHSVLHDTQALIRPLLSGIFQSRRAVTA
jgi:hypothetical protein